MAAVRGDCLRYFYDPESMDAVQVRGVLTRSLGRAPDQIVGVYSTRSFNLPSGAIEPADRSATIAPPLAFDPQSWSDALHFWPANIAAVDGKAVVGSLPIAPYDIFPSQAGISQLLGRGAMIRNSQRSFRTVRPTAHFPARMTGAHSETLSIGKGVPMPASDPGNWCVKKVGWLGGPDWSDVSIGTSRLRLAVALRG